MEVIVWNVVKSMESYIQCTDNTYFYLGIILYNIVKNSTFLFISLLVYFEKNIIDTNICPTNSKLEDWFCLS